MNIKTLKVALLPLSLALAMVYTSSAQALTDAQFKATKLPYSVVVLLLI